MATISAKQFMQGGDISVVQNQPQQAQQPTAPSGPGYLQRVGQSFKDTTQNIINDIKRPSESMAAGAGPLQVGKQVAEAGLRTAGNIAGQAFAPITEAVAPVVNPIVHKIASLPGISGGVKVVSDWASKHPEAAKDLNAVFNIATLGAGSAVEKPIAEATAGALETAGKKVASGIEGAAAKVPELVQGGKNLLGAPAPAPLEAVGQVLQGKTKDIKAGLRGLKEVDTTGVKTYEDLLGRTTNSIETLSKKVDSTLDNTTPVKLKDLKLVGKTTGGKNVSVDYVGRALENLKELYHSTGDDVSAKNIGETITKAKEVGLTRQEVNNLSRTYGQEFSQKAFGKTGEALTSVNAQKFENTRKALKDVARQGLPGVKAKALDESVSNLYRVRDLVKKNVEAVNKLNQKIQQRGLLEKLGYYASKTVDMATGGALRGVFGGILPRGVGYKVMNALDLEQALKRNLNVIQKAIKAGDPEVLKLLKKAKSKGLINKSNLVQ